MTQRLSTLNDPPKLLKGPQLLHQLIQWEKHSDACALDFTSQERRQRYNYRELQSCVRSLALLIQETLSSCQTQTENSPSQHIIPILLPQSPSLYISQLAILESGGAFCPINLDAPKERIKFIVDDVSANIIIITSAFKDAISWENGPAVILVDEFPDTAQEMAMPGRQLREALPQDLAYVMYTSGSTGLPKGVTLSHLAVSQSLLAHERHIPPFKRFLQFAAPSFDVSVFEIFFPLTRGCTLVGCNRSQLLNDLPGMIKELEVDAAELTPTVAGSLLQKRSNAPGLKLLLTIGEMLTRPIIDEFGSSETKEGILYGMYGPTEAAIHCTVYPKMAANASPGNIGVPLDTVSTFIAAASHSGEGGIKFLPVGELGELVLGGPQLAQGYLNRPEQNKAAFVHARGRDYYRTGDKARQLENGTIEILGRMSAGQVKLRGQRVELGEIEEVVYKHPGIKVATVVVLGGTLITFALVGDKSIMSEDVLKTCAQWLPTFMVPSEIIVLQNFPYLPSGKVDKRKLESDFQKQREEGANGSVSTMTPTERIVKESLHGLLGPFPSNMRLAAAGLDSLVAIRLASKLRSSGFAVTTISVLQADTLTALTQLCENSTSKDLQPSQASADLFLEKTTTVLNSNIEDVEYVIPCTPLQSAMLSETAVDEKTYRNWVELNLARINDMNHVISTIRALAEHNPILRTGFMESQDSDGYVQIVWKSFSEAQIEEVENFNYEFEKSKDTSLYYPIRIQIRRLDSSTNLLIHLHHAIYDAWSLELLLDDLDNLLQGETLPPRTSFASVVEGYLNGTISTDSWSSKDYWKDHLAHLDMRQVPNFNSGKVPSTGLAVAKLQTSISTSDIEIAARRLSSSPQSLFQAAFAIILSSYLGSSDICFGTVFSGRTQPVIGIEGIVGPCLATLPVRIDVSTSATLKDLVQELNGMNRKHLEHSALSLRDIKSVSGVNPRQHLFDTLVIWQQTLHSYDHTRKHVSLVDTVDNLEFNLTLEIIPGVGNIELKANYQQSHFPKSQIDFLLPQVEQLVQAIVEDESTAVASAFSHLNIEVVSAENVNPETALKAQTLSSPVERIAARAPNRPAIEFARSIDSGSIEVERMSYGELNARANQMGHHLLSLEVLPDELICICMEKSVELYASILATAKVGAGYLPVTPDVPLQRLQHILREAKVKTILAQSASRPLFKSLQTGKVVYVDEFNFSELSSENIPSRSFPGNLSYCVFTSGSTGTPKGVLVTQGNLLSNLDVLEDLYPSFKNSRLLQSCSQAFDVSAFEIFFAWRIGACLCSAVKDVLFRDIENAIRLLGVTHLSLTPTVAALVDPKNVPNVQFLVTAGEAVTPKVFNAWADRGLYQGYGPSETTNICTVNPKVTRHDSISNIGPPFKNTSAFVLTPGPDFALVPRGGEGEFCFGGSQVFRGYMERSQEVGKIIDHPAYGRLYRSGDFGRLMPDGSLTFTGRKDDQVKIRGQRVELGEINNVMLRLPEVHDCVTMVISSTSAGAQRLVCFWTSRLQTSTSLECFPPDPTMLTTLYKNLESALPAYMIPSALIPISYLPSTTQGKIDKRLLVKQYNALDVSYLDSTSQTTKSSSYDKWTDVELEIAKALAKITKLPLEEISPDISFFSLGIDSISAISFSRVMRQELHLHAEISDILRNPSIARLAEKISSKSQEVDISAPGQATEFDFGFDEKFVKSTTDDFKRAGRMVQRILPCTPLQEAMLSAAESSSDRLYSNQVVFNINGSMERLQKCWREMVRRHEILRTCFVRTDMPRYTYAQVVLEESNLTFSSIGGQPNTTMQLIGLPENVEATSGFGSPWSLNFVQYSGSTKLLVSMHHALYDGIALTVLYEEIETLYHNYSLPPAVPFAPFLQSMISMKTEESDQFWEATLRNISPTRFNRMNHQRMNETNIQRISSKSSLHWVEDSAKKYSTSLLAVCNAVWASILSERTQQSDICFGNIVSGRTVPVDGIERLVAPCFNTIPARLQETHKISYLEAFRKLQILNADSLPFQLTPLRRIQSKFSLDGSRLFDTLFILQQRPRDLDFSIWSIEEDSGTIDFPLVCEVVPKHSEDTLEIILHSYSSIISEKEAFSILKTFCSNLESALQNPRRQLLSATVKEQIISKAINQGNEKSDVENDSGSSKLMTSDELELRHVISSFADVPVDTIGRDVSIFRLGLDSISTVQVAACLRKQGYSVLASDILENPTIAKLSAYIKQRTGTGTQVSEYDFAAFENQHWDAVCANNDIQSEQIVAIRPCTAVQQGMIAQSLHSGGQEYVNSIWFELPPETSISKLKTAWDVACKEHEMLRTGFVPIEDPVHPFAMIAYAKDCFSVPWYDGGTGQWSNDPIAAHLLRRPWSLTLLYEDAKTIIKFTAHHALYDAQSIQMILSDVAKAYASKSIARRPPLTPLLGAILRHGEEGVEAKKLFWEKEENKIVVNRFPDLTPLRKSNASSIVQEMNAQASIAELEESCRQNEVTMQAATQATWARLLAAYVGETSTTFGMTLSGRSIHEDADQISFPSIITLPVRCNVVGTNAELLSRTMSLNATLHKHQFTPLTSIQKWAGYPEGKIFDTLFTYQKLPDNEDEINPPWKIIREEASVDYAVSLEVQPMKSGDLELRLTFREDLIPVEHADLLLKQYDALLLDTLQNPLNSCDVAPQGGNEMLSITPAKESVLPDSVSLLHEYVERGARQWPNKNALEFATRLEPGNIESQSWTYEGLEKEGNKVAQFLVQHQVVPGQIIAICFDKCPEASFAIIGILKAGCAYVALDPNAPSDRLKFIVKDSGAKLVLTAGKPGQKVKESLLDREIITLNSYKVLEGFSSKHPKLSRKITPQDTSYCLYTSGTTGTPKGCLITHENAVQAMLSFQRLFAGHWTGDSKWLQFASFHFDVSVLEQFWSWSVGICVVSAPRDLIFEDIPGAIQQLGVTHIDLTPSLARLLHPDDLPSLCKGVFITGGEQLKQEILDVWGEHGCIYNGYGPTEATIGVTMYPRVPKNGKPSNIGPQFDNVGSFVLKPGTTLPVLRGGVGELCVSGKLVGKGYLNRLDLTAERFPTLETFNERVYRTGDLVRILHDGSFIFLGRADDQVKLRGQRLELSEINEVIKKSMGDLQEVVTLVLKHSTQQKEQLVAFFVTASFGQATKDGSLIPTMRDACKARLPGYMVPTHFIPIKALPLNANNKTDSKQLAAMYNNLTAGDLQKLSHSSQQGKEWTVKEKKIVDVLATTLHVEPTALIPGSNIFELGLDSISIISFARTLQNSGLKNAKLSVVKSNTTIEKLVVALLSDKTPGHGQENTFVAASQNIVAFSQRHMVNVCRGLGIESADIESIAPCTPVQEGMIYRFLESEHPLYFNKFEFRLREHVDADKLLAAWNRVIERLQILRTKFVATDDGFAQVVSRKLDLSWGNPSLDYDTTEKLLALENPYVIKLASTPSESAMMLHIFHGLYDGNSLTMMFRCVIEEYDGFGQVTYGPLFHSSLAYGPLVTAPGAEAFWKDHLKQWAPHQMPTNTGSEQDVAATNTLRNMYGFEELRKYLGVTPQAMIQAAWVSVLKTLISPDLTIGMVTSGRAIDFDGTDKVIGPLFNTVPFHVKIDPGMTSSSLISLCHEFNMQMQDFQHTPLKNIQKWSPAKPGQPLFETLFVFQRPEIDEEEFANHLWTQLEDKQVADVSFQT
jgi:amino acid adenylation domain-containing protein